MNQYIYPMFQTSEKNGCSDLTIAAAMLLDDAKAGVQTYGPDELDYAALSSEYGQLASHQKDVLQFISRHYDVLVVAYQSKDQTVFQATVANCEAQDAADAAARAADET